MNRVTVERRERRTVVVPGRRVARPRHEIRFGASQLALVGIAVVLVGSVVFVLGVLVGQEMAPGRGGEGGLPPSPVATAARPAGPAEPAEGTGGTPAKVPPRRAEERLTFYKTLTAPTPDLPAVDGPRVEERMEAKDDPPAPVSRPPGAAPQPPPPPAPPSPRARPAPERRLPDASARREAPTPLRPRAEAPPAVVPTPSPGVVPTPPPAVAPAPPPVFVPTRPPLVDREIWTVQVSSFLSRSLAEELRARLTVRGFEVHVASAATTEGRVRYRVRVGSYPTRAEAERVAQELRAEGTLTPFVTTRSR
jgi:cell division protein FtsN